MKRPPITWAGIWEILSGIAIGFMTFSSLWIIHGLPGSIWLLLISLAILIPLLLAWLVESIINYIRNFTLYR